MKDVELLDVAASGEGEPECYGTVGELGNLEVEVLGLDVFAGVDAHRVFASAGLENLKGGGVVVAVVLDLHAPGLGTARIEAEHDLIVLELHDAALAPVKGIKAFVFVDGGLCFDCLDRLGNRHGGDSFHGVRETLSECYRILLCLQLSGLAGLFLLIKSKTKKNYGYKDEPYDCIFIHYSCSSLRICSLRAARSSLLFSIFLRICLMISSELREFAKKPMLFSYVSISCWRALYLRTS